jgi:hypothetical protein
MRMLPHSQRRAAEDWEQEEISGGQWEGLHSQAGLGPRSHSAPPPGFLAQFGGAGRAVAIEG